MWGVARTAARMPVPTEMLTEYGKLFENYIFMELKAYIDYNMTDDELCFWRTREGYEVDFIIGDKAASDLLSILSHIVASLRMELLLTQDT